MKTVKIKIQIGDWTWTKHTFYPDSLDGNEKGALKVLDYFSRYVNKKLLKKVKKR